ncbi:MAG: hypothetical protein ABIP82_09640 [Nitrospirales bacterium]
MSEEPCSYTLAATTLHENVDGSLILIHHTSAILSWHLNSAGFLVCAPDVIQEALFRLTRLSLGMCQHSVATGESFLR